MMLKHRIISWPRFGSKVLVGGILLGLLAACTPFSASKQSVAAQLNRQGIQFRQQGKFVEAEQAYQQAVAKDDRYANAWLNLGILYDLYRPDADKALQAYQKFQALQSTPDKEVAAWIKALPISKKPGLPAQQNQQQAEKTSVNSQPETKAEAP
jgi:tetratricopeptide (TPR) repeat protein